MQKDGQIIIFSVRFENRLLFGLSIESVPFRVVGFACGIITYVEPAPRIEVGNSRGVDVRKERVTATTSSKYCDRSFLEHRPAPGEVWVMRDAQKCSILWLGLIDGVTRTKEARHPCQWLVRLGAFLAILKSRSNLLSCTDYASAVRMGSNSAGQR